MDTINWQHDHADNEHSQYAALEIAHLQERVEKLEARNKALGEALEPFAKAHKWPFFNTPMSDKKGNTLTKADFKRAAELLATIKGESHE